MFATGCVVIFIINFPETKIEFYKKIILTLEKNYKFILKNSYKITNSLTNQIERLTKSEQFSNISKVKKYKD